MKVRLRRKLVLNEFVVLLLSGVVLRLRQGWFKITGLVQIEAGFTELLLVLRANPSSRGGRRWRACDA